MTNFEKIKNMKKLFSNIDWILMMRLVMGGSMLIIGYQTNDYIPAVAGGFFILYSIIGAKYKIGCGYNASCGMPSSRSYSKVKATDEIDFTEIK
ncbi:MAG: hypothetical protein RL387_167 [Bacteroidota bacterium]|jgi:hypothetical protein